MNDKTPSREEMLSELQEKFGRKELEFGCRLWITGESFSVDEGYEAVMKDCDDVDKRDGKLWYLSQEADEWYIATEILGHPLTLSDVLDEMNNKSSLLGYSAKPFYTNGLQIEKDGKILFKWKLSKNLLRDQTLETIQAIHKILIPTK